MDSDLAKFALDAAIRHNAANPRDADEVVMAAQVFYNFLVGIKK